jgi:xanthine dehydrogenase large subunit
MKNSVHHDSGRSYVVGDAEYVDDRPITANEVFVDVFYSPIAKGKIKSFDAKKALELPGVLAVYTYKDISHNLWGSIFQDQNFLAEDRVEFAGEAIAVIAADNKDILKAAKTAIEIQFEEEEPILEIDMAIAKKAFIGPPRFIERGDISKALASAPHKLSGFVEMAGQDHFYLESQAAIAYPKENRQIEIHSSSQHPSEVQHLVAEALGLKFSQVVCVVKRMGGGFGGKESQAAPFAVYAALVAMKLQRPARMIATKDDDMVMTGKRNPFKNFYEVGFDESGKILALKASLYSDGGAFADLSTAIMERAMLHLDNAYFIPNFRVDGQVCKTNTPPNTAFRGFGGPKGVCTIESIIEDIAEKLNKDSLEIRKQNVYQKGQSTPYGQVIDDDVLPKLFLDLEKESEYQKRRLDIQKHNTENQSTWRGLSATAVKFGISFTTRHLNQAGALVNFQLDGTVQVSTGATEMGQGVNTKICQVVADCFSIPYEDVIVMSTSTEKIPNTSATAASSGSDLNGQAALKASQILLERLAKVAKCVLARPKEWRGRAMAGAGSNEEIDLEKAGDVSSIIFENGFVFDRNFPKEKISLKELLTEAYLNRQSLSQQAFYRYPGIHFNKLIGQGKPFFYFTNGVAASEVSIDRLTGEMKVLRTDILMDLGRPLNAAIDMGQVTGAFVQGMGWVTTEKLFYNRGYLISHSPSTYKIPSVHDTPRTFNVRLIDNGLNDRNLRGSKAVGEPPLLLGISVWTAIRDALKVAKKKSVPMSIPATQEQIYMKLKGEI